MERSSEIFEEICDIINKKVFNAEGITAKELFNINHAIAENAVATCLSMVNEETQEKVMQNIRDAANTINARLQGKISETQEKGDQ